VKPFYLTDRLNDGGEMVNDFRSPRFGEVGDIFDELRHGVSILDLGLVRSIIRGERNVMIGKRKLRDLEVQ
jgi:hypothetical protein